MTSIRSVVKVLSTVRCTPEASVSPKKIYCPTNLPPRRFSLKVQEPNRKFHDKNGTSHRGARGPKNNQTILPHFYIEMYRKMLKNAVFRLFTSKKVLNRSKMPNDRLWATSGPFIQTFGYFSYLTPTPEGHSGGRNGGNWAQNDHFPHFFVFYID